MLPKSMPWWPILTTVKETDAPQVHLGPPDACLRAGTSLTVQPRDLGRWKPASRYEQSQGKSTFGRPLPPLAARVARHRNAEAPRPESADRDRDRVVRVTAESLTRLMGLAGEALVQTIGFLRWLTRSGGSRGGRPGCWRASDSSKTAFRRREDATGRRRPRSLGQGQGTGQPGLARAGRDGRSTRGVYPRQ